MLSRQTIRSYRLLRVFHSVVQLYTRARRGGELIPDIVAPILRVKDSIFLDVQPRHKVTFFLKDRKNNFSLAWPLKQFGSHLRVIPGSENETKRVNIDSPPLPETESHPRRWLNAFPLSTFVDDESGRWTPEVFMFVACHQPKNKRKHCACKPFSFKGKMLRKDKNAVRRITLLLPYRIFFARAQYTLFAPNTLTLGAN